MKKSDKLDIVYEDKNILVVNKPAHMLCVQTDKGVSVTLYNKVYEYLHKKNQKVFIVHRLDKDTSGLVLFAKNEDLKNKLQDNWNDIVKVREYYTVVEGSIKEDKGTIKQYLKENKQLKTYVSKDGKLAITHFEVMKRSKNYTILKILIETGRKNQIRVAMESIGHPIFGDTKYGSTKNPLRRMCLHASRLVLINPITHKEMEFVSKIPKEFDIFAS